MGRSGLVGSLEVTADPNILIFRAEYRPTSVTDYPPKINANDDFQVVGGTPALQFDNDDVVPFGGVGVIIERKNGSGVTVILNTEKGKDRGLCRPTTASFCRRRERLTTGSRRRQPQALLPHRKE